VLRASDVAVARAEVSESGGEGVMPAHAAQAAARQHGVVMTSRLIFRVRFRFCPHVEPDASFRPLQPSPHARLIWGNHRPAWCR